MSTNVVNQVAYLRTTREFPYEDSYQMSVEVTKAYLDTANAVNNRTIGIFPKNKPAINGEEWFLTSSKQQGFRQVYTFTSLPATIPHGITVANIYGFTRIYGAFTDGTLWYPLPYVAIAGGVASQTEVYLDNTNIYVTSGAGGPAATKGQVVLEWISNP